MKKYDFMLNGYLSRRNIANHRIALSPTDSPIYSAQYCAGPRQGEIKRKRIEKMRKAGIVEPAVTKWASPVVFAPKDDGGFRFCVDYHRLKAVMERDSYLVRRMDLCIDLLRKLTMFYALTFRLSFCQIKIDGKRIN